MRLMYHPHTCTDKWRPTASTLCPHDRKALELCHSYTQNKAQKHHPQRIPGYWWLFQTQHLSHYSARLVEEKKMNNSDFCPFQVCHFRIVTTHCYYYCNRLYKLLYVVLDASICSPAMISPCINANTLIGAAILKSGHPYIWTMLPRANNMFHYYYLHAVTHG